jgi:hypothetical protein
MEEHGSSQAARTEPGQYWRRPQGPSSHDRDFGNLEELKKQFNAFAAAIQGSGWAWLSLNPNGRLSIETTPNPDPLLSEYSTGTL